MRLFHVWNFKILMQKHVQMLFSVSKIFPIENIDYININHVTITYLKLSLYFTFSGVASPVGTLNFSPHYLRLI